MKFIGMLAAVVCLLTLNAAAAEPTATESALFAAKVSDAVVLSSVPVFPGQLRNVKLNRLDPYAADARMVLVENGVETELPRSDRRFFLGESTDGNSRVALSSDVSGGDIHGVVYTGTASFELAFSDSAGWELKAAPTDYPPGERPTFQCGNTPLGSPVTPTPDVLALAPNIRQDHCLTATPIAPRTALATRTATVAFDVDIEAMANKFGNSTATATTYLATFINVMNASYDAPLNVQLLVGTAFFNIGTDPYGTTTNTNAQLDLLGAYWRDNHAGVARAFVMLISAVQPSGCSASGVAWVNAYCRNGTPGTTNVYGSYSVNQLFYGCGTINDDMRVAAHELGHNFGASHTHCTVSGGGFIDQCFNGEAANGCYSGVQSCPSDNGTLMSYCHLFGGCSPSLQFHPVHVGLLTPKINAAEAANCIKPVGGVDTIFANGFQ